MQIRLASQEFVSATLSGGSGSKSYTRNDVEKIAKTLDLLRKRVRNWRKLLGGQSGGVPKSIYTIYEM